MRRKWWRLAAGVLLAFMALPATAGEARIDSFRIPTPAPENRELEFVVRVPAGYVPEKASDYRLMVLFGGRNWPGKDALTMFDFNALADTEKLFLLSPSFCNDEYWEPEAWSGVALEQAIRKLEADYRIDASRNRFYYGYSAGGQCANLFYHYNPDAVAAWGAHACGVWHTPEARPRQAPALVTCGIGDYLRWTGIRVFLAAYRRAGGGVLWKSFPGDHEFSSGVRELAVAFFAAVARKERVQWVGDDDSMTVFSAASPEAGRLNPEYTSRIYNDEILELWRR